MGRQLSTLIYAPGGGRGHVQRARALARQRLEPCEIWGSGELAGLPRREVARRLSRAQASTLVVDTFPGGLDGEIDDAVLASFERRVLLARHLLRERYPTYDALAARFDEIWLPYTPETCEWGGALQGRYLGLLVRRVRVAEGRPAPLVLIGPGELLPRGWRAALPPGTVHVDGPFEVLPAAELYLGLGAGYNLVWELVLAGLPALHLPQARRYDDQFQRVERLGRGVYTRRELVATLDATAGRTRWL